MAYIKFCIIAVETSLKEQSIYITFNKELDSDTLNYQNIILAINGTVSAPLASYNIILGDDLKTLKLQFTDSPTVNQPYILVLQDKISDLEGNTLDKSLFRNIIFKSSVTSDITLNSPANFEIITSQNFSWTENGDNLVNSYRVEHAKELIRQHPEMKITSISMECGFANEVTFYRTFKTLTGMTPSEWKAKID